LGEVEVEETREWWNRRLEGEATTPREADDPHGEFLDLFEAEDTLTSSSADSCQRYDLFHGLSTGFSATKIQRGWLLLILIGTFYSVFNVHWLFTCSIPEPLVTLKHDPNLPSYPILIFIVHKVPPFINEYSALWDAWQHINEGEHRRECGHVSSEKYASLIRQEIQEPFSARHLLSYCSRPIQR